MVGTDNIRIDFVTDYRNFYDNIQDVSTFDFRYLLYRAYTGYVYSSYGIASTRHWVAPTHGSWWGFQSKRKKPYI